MSKLKFTFNPASDSTFSVTLDNVGYDISLLWLDVYEVWAASISTNGEAVTDGRVVKLNQDLLGNVPNVGKLCFEGDKPTRTNIGRDCFLYYYEVSE